MANEKRPDLIDRNELLPNKVFYVCNENPMASLDELLNRIVNVKTVDAVEVVRCNTCVYWDKATVNKKGYLICPASGMEIMADDFCSYGERRS